MNYNYILAGTLFTILFVTHMLAFAAFTERKKVYVRKRYGQENDSSDR